MPPLQATLQHTPGWWPPVALTIAALFVVGVVIFAVLRWPLTGCRRCKGRGKLFEPGAAERYWRPCPACKGSGTRHRLGRRVLDALFTRSTDNTQ